LGPELVALEAFVGDEFTGGDAGGGVGAGGGAEPGFGT
jgi:hypothetical protein